MNPPNDGVTSENATDLTVSVIVYSAEGRGDMLTSCDMWVVCLPLTFFSEKKKFSSEFML